MQNVDIFGGIEAGGTKFVCAIGSGGGELLAREEIATSQPDETMSQIYKFFRAYGGVEKIGIGSFGPIDLKPTSKTYGSILSTPKKGWSNVNMPKLIKKNLGADAIVATDTDVAAIGEHYYGKAVGRMNFAYVTVGTGIGGSIIVGEKLVHGISHPELGHIKIPHDLVADPVKGVCVYHDDCLEGLASGRSIELRHCVSPSKLDKSEIWEQEARYLAYGLVSLIAIIQPEIIIMGGSVMKRPQLIDMIRQNVDEYVNNYFNLPNLEKYVVRSSSDSIGVLGAIKLATL